MRNHEEHINAAKHVFTCLCTQKSILPGESKTTRWAKAKVHMTALVDVFRVIGIVVGRRGPRRASDIPICYTPGLLLAQWGNHCVQLVLEIAQPSW